jgi:hypothetical protein
MQRTNFSDQADRRRRRVEADEPRAPTQLGWSALGRVRHATSAAATAPREVDSVAEVALTGTFPLSYARQGDLFGYGLLLADRRRSSGERQQHSHCHNRPRYESQLFVSSPHALVYNVPRSGALYFYRESERERDDKGGCDAGSSWRRSQVPFSTVSPVGSLPDAMVGLGKLAGGGPDGWLFSQAVDEQSMMGAGEVLALRNVAGDEWKLNQRIFNPDGPSMPYPQFGFNVSYDSGTGALLVGPRFGTEAFVYAYATSGPAAGKWMLRERLALPPRDAELAPWLVSDCLLVDGRWALVSFAPFGLDGEPSGNGSVAVFELPDPAGAWTLRQVLRGFDEGDQYPSDLFGFSLSASPLSSRARGRCGTRHSLAVGAPWDSQRPAGPHGAVYFFGIEAGEWVAEQKVLPEADAGRRGFGYKVALRGYVAAVADPLRGDEPPLNGGAVVVLERTSALEGWQQVATLTDPNAFERELLGAGDVRIDDRFVVASSNGLAPYLLEEDAIIEPQPGRVLTWRRSVGGGHRP